MARSTRFSPSAGWDQVRQWTGRHMQALIALAGVFFLLPTLVLSFFGPVVAQPAFDPNSDISVYITQMQAAFAPLIPWIIVLTVIQIVGQLAILAVVATRTSATVGEAIAIAFQRLGYLILAQIVLGVALGVAFFLLAIVAGLATAVAPALGILVGFALLVLFAYVSIRFSLVAAILVAEEHRWPIPLLRRSWDLTGGNVLNIFLFFLIVMIAFIVISVVVAVVFGLLLLPLGAAGTSVLQVVNGVISAAGTVIFTLMSLAIWQQLAGDATSTPEVFS